LKDALGACAAMAKVSDGKEIEGVNETLVL
jgi:hypothetical protein